MSSFGSIYQVLGWDLTRSKEVVFALGKGIEPCAHVFKIYRKRSWCRSHVDLHRQALFLWSTKASLILFGIRGARWCRLYVSRMCLPQWCNRKIEVSMRLRQIPRFSLGVSWWNMVVWEVPLDVVDGDHAEWEEQHNSNRILPCRRWDIWCMVFLPPTHAGVCNTPTKPLLDL